MASLRRTQELFREENVYSIILCGGWGTRLWPLSRKAFAKQFLTLGGAKRSLLQSSIDRLKSISPASKRWLVTAGGQEKLAAAQSGSDVSRILVEPAARNTAAAVAYAAYELLKTDKDAVMLIISSDHVVQNVGSFEETIFDAVTLAKQNHFVTVGIQPTHPATGFGYIERGSALGKDGVALPTNLSGDELDAKTVGFSVRSFREKPNQAAAEQFLRTGRYLWNAGIFAWKASAFWEAFAKLQPEMARFFEKASAQDIANNYASLPSIPIDIAFLEQTNHVACVPALFDWNDVGSWAAVRECFDQDAQGNSVSGDVYLSETRGSVIHSSGPYVAAIGLEDTCIVATPDAVLVMPLSRSQDVKKVIASLESSGRKELL